MSDGLETRRGGVLVGFLTGVGLHLVCIPALAYMVYGLESMGSQRSNDPYNVLPMFVIFLPGIFQVVYILPGYFIARRRGARKDFLKGFTLSATLLFLLNIGFCGTLALSN